MTTKTLPTRTVQDLPQAIIDGIVNGDLDHVIEEVKISAKISPTKKDESKEFDALYALTPQGMAILCGGKFEPQTPKPADGKDERTDEQKRIGACDHFNYGRILSVRQQVRASLEASLEGPEKVIAKAVKANMEAGIYDSEAEAKAAIIEQMKAKGKIPADYRG